MNTAIEGDLDRKPAESESEDRKYECAGPWETLLRHVIDNKDDISGWKGTVQAIARGCLADIENSFTSRGERVPRLYREFVNNLLNDDILTDLNDCCGELEYKLPQCLLAWTQDGDAFTRPPERA